MKKVSGEFLSKVLWTLQQCNVAERSREEIRTMLMTALDADDVYVDVPETVQVDLDTMGPAPRAVTLDTGSLERLNAMLPWSSFSTVGQQGSLGAPWSAHKRHVVTRYPDAIVSLLHKRLPLTGMSVLELGCFEGHHSISLAQHAREVWGIDGRIENVIKTLVRVWMAGMERSVVVNLLNLELGTLKQQLAALGRTEPFDLVHHRGVLYHLSDPVANLVQCAEVSSKHLYIHTQIARDDQVDAKLSHATGDYEVFRYREPKVEFAPFAGITEYAHWMTQASLERLLRNIGFGNIDVMSVVAERNGLRMELVASR